MAKNSTRGTIAVYPAAGGLESISIPGMTTAGRVTDGSNFIININGSKKKHPGVVRKDDGSQILAPEGYAKALYDHWRISGNSKVRKTLLVASGKVWADNGGNGTFVPVTSPFSIIPYDNVSMTTFFGLLVLCFENNPGGRPLKYDHTTLAQMASGVPNAKYARTWFNRLWLGGILGAPDRLKASAPDEPEEFGILNGAKEFNFDQGDHDPIGLTGIMPPLRRVGMAVGKRESIHKVYPSGNTFATDIVTEAFGLLSHNSAVAFANDVVFASDQGVHSLQTTEKFGEVETSYLSAQIQDYYQENMAFESAENMRAIYAKEINSYLLAATTKASAVNDIVLAYNFLRGEWSKWEEQVSAFARWVDPLDNNKSKILVCDDRGRVGILDTTAKGPRVVTWFDERRTMRFTTGLMYPLGVDKEVTFCLLKCYFKPQTKGSFFTVTCLVDGKIVSTLEVDMSPSDTSVIGTAVIGTDKIQTEGSVKEVARELKGVGSSIELVFSHAPQSDEEDCEIFGFIVEYEYSGETQIPKQQ
ncbi:MAG: hypothetical protein F9K48_00370 [Candidatus Brocadia sp.]|nr:MAG: hypothetical protein F9K48_00370 [Candidatus Brocadia sp.]